MTSEKDMVNIVLYWWNNWPKQQPGGGHYIDCIVRSIQKHMPDIPYKIILFTDLIGYTRQYVDCRSLLVPCGLKWNLRKMYMYSKRAGLVGPTICFDLDCIILSDLTSLWTALFNLQKPYLIITCEAVYHKGLAGGSVVGFHPCPELEELLWSPILQNQRAVEDLTDGSERIYFRHKFTKQTMRFWEDIIPGKIISYKRDCIGKCYPSEDAVVVRFHGRPRPHEVQDMWVKEYLI